MQKRVIRVCPVGTTDFQVFICIFLEKCRRRPRW